MGLDLYVGSLTRYYARDWELIAQNVGRELGYEVQVIRQHDSEDAIRDPEVIRPSVIAWRERLSQALIEDLSEPLDWDESMEAPYFTDKPTWDCYADLLLWAAYDEQRHRVRPEGHVEEWAQDAAYQACTADTFASRYSHLFEATLWLPCRFDFLFQTQNVGGDAVTVGSSVALRRQLWDLNDRTWRADEAKLDQWRRDRSEYGSPLETGARFAFALFLHLTQRSIEYRLPMTMDW